MLLALALVAGGCGGSSTGNFKKDFTTKDRELQKLGNDLATTLRTASKGSDLALASKFDGLASRVRKLVADLGKLKPPAKDQSDFATLRSSLTAIAGDMTASGSAARAHNPNAFKSAIQKLVANSPSVKSTAAAIRQNEGIKRPSG